MLNIGTMTAQLALDLDHDAIRLLSRQSDGWVVEGVAELDATDITAGINRLRQRAEDLGGADPAVTLVLPRSQVLYTAFDGDPADVERHLAGKTPYDTSEITWDVVSNGDRVQVAAVAYETLEEAIGFASSSRFKVIGLTSEPPEGLFPRLPVFTQKEAATPVVLEPTTAPARKEVAFSSQRSREYGPRARRLHLQPDEGQSAPHRRRGAAIIATLGALPKPAIAAAAVGALAVSAYLLWPASDPDPFTKRDFSAEFASLPVAMEPGLTAPSSDETPAIANGDAVTVLRSAPAIVVPVVLGGSGIVADYNVDVSSSRVFAAFATLPLINAGPSIDRSGNDRPSVLQRPAFPLPTSIETGTVSVAFGPAPLPPAPLAGLAPTIPDVVAANAIAREASRIGTAAPDTFELSLLPLPRRQDAPVAPNDLSVPAADENTVELAALPPDAVASPTVSPLPEAGTLVARLPNAAMSLAAPEAGTDFELNSDGFVEATPDGSLSPDGVLVFAGSPPRIAPPRPVAVRPEVNVGSAQLAAVTPRARPVARAATNPVEVAAVDAAVAAAGASTFPLPDGPSAAPPEEEPSVPDALIAEALAQAPVEAAPSETILAASLVPRPRPARAPRATAASATRAANPAPRIPSSASVAREATIENGIQFQRINLIGVYGSSRERRALVRLPSGKFVKLQVGDRLDGGQVAQIGPDSLVYRKGGRNLSLAMPNT